MDKILSELRLPFYIIIALAIAFIFIQLSSAYDSYWRAKFIRLRYKKLLYDFENQLKSEGINDSNELI